MTSILKEKLSRRKYKIYLLSSFQETKLTQISGSVIADRIEQIKQTRFELDLIKSLDGLAT